MIINLQIHEPTFEALGRVFGLIGYLERHRQMANGGDAILMAAFAYAIAQYDVQDTKRLAVREAHMAYRRGHSDGLAAAARRK